MIKAVIFDWDGLAVDTESIHELKEQVFSKKYGYVHTPELKQELMGLRADEVAAHLKKRFKLQGSIEDFVAERSLLYDQFYFKQVKPMPGFIDKVNLFKEKGFCQAIATSSQPKYVEYGLRKFGLEGIFQLIAYSSQVAQGKPAPDIYLYVSQRLGFSPQECLALEDSIHGVRSAKSGGMHCIAVVDTRYNRPEAFTSLADIVLLSLSELTLEHISLLQNKIQNKV